MSTNTQSTDNTKTVVLHVVGYDKCPYLYQACLYARVCKNRKRCSEYRITSLKTPKEFREWVQGFVHTHPQTAEQHIDMTSSPFVFNETNHTYMGGFSELFAFMQDVVVPNDQNQHAEQKRPD
jgi:hypothetical protein